MVICSNNRDTYVPSNIDISPLCDIDMKHKGDMKMKDIDELINEIRTLEEEIENIILEDCIDSNQGINVNQSDPDNDHEGGYESETQCNGTEFELSTPFGKLLVDLKEYHKANKNAKNMLNPPKPSTKRRMIIEFLESVDRSDVRWYPSRIGAMIKMHMDSYFKEYTLVKEFELDSGLEVEALYSNISVQNEQSKRYIQTGVRFYDTGSERFVVQCSVDRDGDERIVIITGKEGRGLEIIDELEDDFYLNGLLKGEFFDMNYNFINRSEIVKHLIAWDSDIKSQLDKDVLKFLQVMPTLRERGLPNSRGIILSGPPGTGKTMMAKSIAADANVTTILISAEMIREKNQIKNAFRVARKLSPSLMIIEDIDTAGTVSRRFTDHPILGEYLQAMDGMESNDGMVILSTTNHTENIDPAISDRPGRFDRIIDVQLPSKKQREQIIRNLLAKMPTDEITNAQVLEIAKKSEGLSGAWIREIVQCSYIEAINYNRDKISLSDLKFALKDVLSRRGIAYKGTPTLSCNASSRSAEVYTI